MRRLARMHHQNQQPLYNYENQLWAVFPFKIIVMSVQFRPRTCGQITGCQIIIVMYKSELVFIVLISKKQINGKNRTEQRVLSRENVIIYSN